MNKKNLLAISINIECCIYHTYTEMNKYKNYKIRLRFLQAHNK